MSALSLSKELDGSVGDIACSLALAEQAFKAALEVLSMRAQYFHDNTDHGVEEARQMTFLVEQGHEAVNSLSYRMKREDFTGKLKTEAAKQLANARLKKASKKKKKKKGGATSSAADSE